MEILLDEPIDLEQVADLCAIGMKRKPPTDGTRVCKTCGIEKPVSSFKRNSKGYLLRECWECKKARLRSRIADFCFVCGKPVQYRSPHASRKLCADCWQAKVEHRADPETIARPREGDFVHGRDIGHNPAAGKFRWTSCSVCGDNPIWMHYRRLRERRVCRDCSQRIRWTGEKNPSWQGGKRITTFGYVDCWISKDSPFFAMASSRSPSGRGGYVKEHRLVIAQHLGRCLEKWEVVHHINGDKTDNRLENLDLVKPSDHALFNEMQREMRRLREKVKHLESRLSDEVSSGHSIR